MLQFCTHGEPFFLFSLIIGKATVPPLISDTIPTIVSVYRIEVLVTRAVLSAKVPGDLGAFVGIPPLDASDPGLIVRVRDVAVIMPVHAVLRFPFLLGKTPHRSVILRIEPLMLPGMCTVEVTVDSIVLGIALPRIMGKGNRCSQ
jgi:hypothetical protein